MRKCAGLVLAQASSHRTVRQRSSSCVAEGGKRLTGFVANTCIESTARFGMELGYHVTLIKDATAAFDAEGMHAAHEINGPRFAHAMLTLEELLTLLPSHSRNENQEVHR